MNFSEYLSKSVEFIRLNSIHTIIVVLGDFTDHIPVHLALWNSRSNYSGRGPRPVLLWLTLLNYRGLPVYPVRAGDKTHTLDFYFARISIYDEPIIDSPLGKSDITVSKLKDMLPHLKISILFPPHKCIKIYVHHAADAALLQNPGLSSNPSSCLFYNSFIPKTWGRGDLPKIARCPIL